MKEREIETVNGDWNNGAGDAHLHEFVVLAELGLLLGGEAFHTGEELGEELVVVGGEVYGCHAVHAQADLFLEQVVGLVDEDLEEELQEGEEDAAPELELGEGRGGEGRGGEGRGGEGREGKGRKRREGRWDREESRRIKRRVCDDVKGMCYSPLSRVCVWS